MKKLKFLGAVAMATVLLTSCLDGGSNEKSYEAYAVVKMSTKSFKMLAYENDYYPPIYHPSLDALDENQCIRAWKKINGDDPANQSGNEYYTASEMQFIKIPTGNAYSAVEDTTVIKDNEMTILDVAGGYFKGMLFLVTSHPNASSDQTNEITLSYDRNQEVEEVNGERVYNLYVRAVKKADGKTNTGNVAFENAYPMSSFFSYASGQEKNNKKEHVYYRFNYIKEFNKDSTEATWATSKVLDYPIPAEK